MRGNYSDDYYLTFSGFLWAVFVTVSIRTLAAVYAQCRYDVFFIDWEKPRGALFRHGGDVEDAGARGAKAAPLDAHKVSSVSVWRKIFAANEWAEMATQRRTSTLITLLVLAAILEGGGARFVATPQPVANNLAADAINPVLQFAISMFWYWVICAIQLVWAVAISERYIDENPAARFLDLCTLMKISVLVMDEKYRGYYMHGNSPHEYADGSMAEVALNLYEEGAAMRTGRGLPGAPDASCQSFELHVPLLWREQFDRIYTSLVDAADAGSGAGGALGARHPAGSVVSGAFSSAAALSTLGAGVERTRRLVSAHDALTSFLRGFITESEPDFKRIWRDRTIAHSVLDYPPDMVAEGAATSAGMSVTTGMRNGGAETSRVSYMFTDPHMRFERATFLGIEYELLVFEAIVFCLVDFLLGSRPTISAAIVIAIQLLLKFARERYGRANLAAKTLVDPAFLL